MSLACAGDIVLASESARFTMAYTQIGLTPDGAYSRTYCGDGSFTSCQTAQRDSLLAALSVTPAQIYGRGACAGNPQASCFDMNGWVTAGGFSIPRFPFQNRPTFQQVVELTRTLPR